MGATEAVAAACWVVFVPKGVDHEALDVQSVLRALPGPSGVLVVPNGVDFAATLKEQALEALIDHKAFTRWQQSLADPSVWPSQATREHLARYLRETLR